MAYRVAHSGTLTDVGILHGAHGREIKFQSVGKQGGS